MTRKTDEACPPKVATSKADVWWRWSALGVVFVGLLFWLSSQLREPPRPAVVHKPEPQILLTISGSNTLGATLIPMLAERFLLERGAASVRRVQGRSPVEMEISGTMASDAADGVIRLAAHGSSTGFRDLAAGRSDVAASSRPIKSEEAAQLKQLGFGDMTSLTNEHLVGLDGVAIIVHPENPVDSLTTDQVARIFTGEIQNWSSLGGPDRRISIYARDDNSGTYDTFQTLVMGKSRRISKWALRFEDSLKLFQMVQKEPSAIGFVGLPYILSGKALAIIDHAGNPIRPTYFTVKREIYPLTRRLYLYTAAEPVNGLVGEFMAFCLSNQGQRLVREALMVDLSIRPELPLQESELVPGEAATLTAGADYALSVHFVPGQDLLDNRAMVDLNRFIAYMGETENQDKAVVLIGHAHGTGNSQANHQRSQASAQQVAGMLKEAGVGIAAVHGMGDKAEPARLAKEAQTHLQRVEIFLRGTERLESLQE